MPVTLLATPEKVSIYEGVTDEPFSDPLGNLGRIKFDSTFSYVPFVPSRTIQATVPIPTDLGSDRVRSIVLAPHGQPGVPFIFGYATYGGNTVPMQGSIQMKVPNNVGATILWLLGVDTTNVFIAELRPNALAFSATESPVVTVFISNRLAA